MDNQRLHSLALGELKTLCRNREIKYKSNITTPAAVSKIMNYHHRNKYKALNFDKELLEWKKEELIPEAKAIGVKRASSLNKSQLADMIIYGKDPEENHNSKSRSSRSRSNSNRSAKSREPSSPKSVSKTTNQKSRRSKTTSKKKKRSSKLVKLPELTSRHKALDRSWDKLDKLLITIFNDLKVRFHPYYDEHEKVPELPHDFRDFEGFPLMAEATRPKVKAFGDKLMMLMPKIKEAKSMAADFVEYTQKRRRFEQRQIDLKRSKSKSKSAGNTYFIAMKKYKKERDFEADRTGPICGVFRDKEHFNEWRRNKATVKRYGRGIKLIKHVQSEDEDTDRGSDGDGEGDLDMESDRNHNRNRNNESMNISKLEATTSDEDPNDLAVECMYSCCWLVGWLLFAEWLLLVDFIELAHSLPDWWCLNEHRCS